MTVSSEIARWDYVGDGSNDTFPFTAEIYDETDLKVYVDDVIQTVNTAYTIAAADIDNPAGGNVVFATAYIPANDAAVVILLDLPITQEANYVEGDKFPAETHEKALDRLTKIAQAQKNAISKCIRFAPYSDPDLVLPDPSANAYLGWNSDASNLENKAASLTVAATMWEVDALVTYGGGTAYTKATLDAALTAIGTSSKVTLLLRPGNWTITASADYSAYSNVKFRMPNGAYFTVSTGQTLTLPSTENLIADADQQLFVLAGTGVVRFAKGGKFHPGHWGAKGDATTNDYTALQACIDAYKALMTSLATAGYRYDNFQGPTLEMIPGRIYMIETSLYAGGSTTSCLKWWNGNGATIIGKTTGQPIIVNTGGHVWAWRDLVVEGDSVAIPSCGIFLCRNLAGDGSGGGHFTNVFLEGSFTYAPVYNYGSEVNIWTNCWFIVRSGHAAVILTNDNNRAVAVSAGQTIAAGAQSSLTQTFINCEFATYDATAGVLTLHSALEIDGWREVRLYDCELNTDYGEYGGTAPNRPQVLIKNTSVNPEHIAFTGCLFHGEYLYAIEGRGTSLVLKDLQIKGCHWGSVYNNPDNSRYQLYTGSTDAVLSHSWIEAPNISWAATGADMIDDCYIDITGFTNNWVDATNRHYFNVASIFSGTLHADSTDNVTFGTSTASYVEGIWFQNDISAMVLANKVTICEQEIATASVTATTLWSATMPDESAWAISAKVVMRRTTTASIALYEVTGLVYRDAGGAATLHGYSTLNSIGLGAELADVELTVSTNDVRLTVTADSANATFWTGKIEVIKAK